MMQPGRVVYCKQRSHSGWGPQVLFILPRPALKWLSVGRDLRAASPVGGGGSAAQRTQPARLDRSWHSAEGVILRTLS